MRNLIIALFLSFLFVACSEESNFDSNITAHSRSNDLETIFLTDDELSNDPDFQQIVNSLNLDWANPFNLDNEEDEYIVDRRRAIKLISENDNYISFTFAITKSPFGNSDLIQNLVLQNKNEIIESQFFKYDIKDDDLINLYNFENTVAEYMSFEKLNINPNQVSFRGCEWVFIQHIIPCPCADHYNPSICNCGTPPSVTQDFYWHCGGVDGEEGNGIPLPNNNPGSGPIGDGGGGGAGGTAGGNGGSSTVPSSNGSTTLANGTIPLLSLEQIYTRI